jgi:23S rRNA (pseudouridine1915-N3)-methyltransferase
LKQQAGELPNSVEGYNQAEWVLADYGDLLVHIFSPKAREYYAWSASGAAQDGRDSARVKIYSTSSASPKTPHANALAGGFSGPRRPLLAAEMREIRPERFDLWAKHPPRARFSSTPPASHGFRRLRALIAKAEMEGRDLVFLVGGHDGLPAGWAARADLLISLSAMTFPHELARAMLAEQIYRAFATLRGHPYPR